MKTIRSYKSSDNRCICAKIHGEHGSTRFCYIDNNTDSDTVLFAGSNEVQEKKRHWC